MPKSNIIRNGGERGSALMIVFLFAAVIAISLYMEMPVVVFEAKRAKEQLLIDRGSEYAHAVKLYYRKFRAYPASIDALESTNNMRFLRHRFKDPMTGEDNWRLLHAGPGGQLTDSKVNPIALNANGQGGNSTSGSGNNGTSGFGSSSFGSSPFGSTGPTNNGAGLGASASSAVGLAGTMDNGTGVPMVAGLPQRPPEMPAGGSGISNSALNADPTQSLLPSPDAQTVNGQNPTGQVAGLQSSGLQNSNLGNPNAQSQPGQGMQIAPVAIPGSPAPSAQAAAAGAASPSNPMQGVQGLFANPNPIGAAVNPPTNAPIANASTTGGIGSPASAGTSTTQSGMGVLQSGGIAGVASIAKGTSIKTVNDQTDYSLWEFYYDPTKDTAGVGQSGINPLSGVNQPANSNGASTPFGSTTNAPLNSTGATTSASSPSSSSTPPNQQ